MFSRLAVVTLALITTAPALAAPATVCATTPTQLRTAATSADIGAQKKAMLLISAGERLCQADARDEASKKFAAAARALGVDMAVLPTATALAQ